MCPRSSGIIFKPNNQFWLVLNWCWVDTSCHITIFHEHKLCDKWPVAGESLNATRLGEPECHRQSRDSRSARGRILWVLLLLHLGTPQAFLPPPWCHKELSLLPSGVGCDPIPTKGCSGFTPGRNQRGQSHVDLKNIKMITSSRVTFLFIYRISQLCMTNFAQSHYLEQFV